MKKQNRRVAVFVDGFNLYHAIDDLNYVFENRQKLEKKPVRLQVPHYKWLDLWKLSESFLRDYQELVSVNYYSAYANHRGDAVVRRHQAYVKALEQSGVRVVMGVFKGSRQGCKSCGARWIKNEEKESDVRIATDIVAGALLDQFDDAMLISADSDMKPAKEHVETTTPEKNIFVVAPPGRFGHARDLHPIMEATKGRIAKSLFPREISDSEGNLLTTRPTQYDPPD